ncbi:MAG TPA: M1 family metallopeptidase [Saprospiraceae bacterium]|nr:M1 family metallopeptidase [Saprospiraceae bacterium]HPN67880.1 M1 family metallopeptidase [Saprospiraceae bacterium]
MMAKLLFSILLGSLFISNVIAQGKFEQLGPILPTPNSYRTASGAPGHEYWQQRADYNIKVTLDDNNQSITGSETITYFNNSPDALTYLWLQLDQNQRAKDSDSYKISTSKVGEEMTEAQADAMLNDFDGGHKISSITDITGKPLKYTIQKTMMRVELPAPLLKGQSFSFAIKWSYNINDRLKIGGRSGYEYFPKDDNYLYTIAQFFPRMCVYDDVSGWQNKQFLGAGEFTLTFGNYLVEITVPEDHLVAATGELQNMPQLLTKNQLAKYNKAKTETVQPIIIATEEEALEREKTKLKGTKTWKFKADNVRDFAFASSRKFIWDAMAVVQNGKTIMAMSMYPKEGNPLWEKYSTKAVAHTLNTYSQYTFDYPYPVAWSINADKIGMEYPMICFNFGRCEEDGSYTERVKYGMISVIIHEVGHNYFPMIVNSDERQWTWMDEGLNSYLQFLSESQWQRDYPSRRGPAENIVSYMSGEQSGLTPIMTNSENIKQFGNNAYGKPATALNILRETILGRELFDYAFKEYSNRWKFKNPTPADFFRTIEDASSVDLDWFWKGWFYGTDPVDLSIEEVKVFKSNPSDPKALLEMKQAEMAEAENYIYKVKNKKEIQQTYVEKDTTLLDMYNKQIPNAALIEKAKQTTTPLTPTKAEQMTYYQMTFKNMGGLPMPIIMSFEYTDGTTEKVVIPAEIWRFDDKSVTKVFPREKEIKSVVLDPNYETADIDRSNNHYPKKEEVNRFQLFKERESRP